MAVYEKKPKGIQKIVIQIMGILEKMMSNSKNMKMISFFMRYTKFEKVTRFMKNISIGE